jgi:hypothetical protein
MASRLGMLFAYFDSVRTMRAQFQSFEFPNFIHLRPLNDREHSNTVVFEEFQKFWRRAWINVETVPTNVEMPQGWAQQTLKLVRLDRIQGNRTAKVQQTYSDVRAFRVLKTTANRRCALRFPCPRKLLSTIRLERGGFRLIKQTLWHPLPAEDAISRWSSREPRPVTVAPWSISIPDALATMAL